MTKDFLVSVRVDRDTYRRILGLRLRINDHLWDAWKNKHPASRAAAPTYQEYPDMVREILDLGIASLAARCGIPPEDL